MQPESFRKKYTDSRGVMDKLRDNLCASAEGAGSYSGGMVKSFSKSYHDFYLYMSLQDAKMVDDYCNLLTAVNVHL